MDEFPQQRQSQAIGLTLSDFYDLPRQQRQLINWIRQQNYCSLLEIAVHFCQDEETILKLLIPLVERGFLQQNRESDGLYYRVLHPFKRGRQLPSKLLQALKEKEEKRG